MFPESTPLGAWLFTLLVVAASLLLHWWGCYSANVCINFNNERLTTLWGGWAAILIAFACLFMIGSDHGKARWQGDPLQKLAAGEIYQVNAQSGEYFILTRTSTKMPVFFTGKTVGGTPKIGDHFIPDTTGNWHLTDPPSPKPTLSTK